jgi:amino acid transporter
LPASPKTPASLPKRTNWWGAFVIGLAGTILVTGVAPFAVQSMGAASIPAFLLVSSAGLFLCLCLAELSAMMPDRTGGLPSYAFETYKCFGPGVARHIGGILLGAMVSDGFR